MRQGRNGEGKEEMEGASSVVSESWKAGGGWGDALGSRLMF